VGRDLRKQVEDAIAEMFQSTRPRGARHFVVYDVSDPYDVFQSTRPRGARPRRNIEILFAFQCFNPRARVGRDMYSLSR